MNGPLDSIRVLELGAFHTAPAAAYMLGDLGAEVIKIEPRVRGDSSRGILSLWGVSSTLPGGRNVPFETANRNKKSITLDLSKERGREVLYRLVRRSDVFLTNYNREQTARLKVDYSNLGQYNPKLIYGMATGMGSRTRHSEARSFDPIAQARSGLMTMAGEAGTPPGEITGGIIDQTTATLLAYGVMAALLARERTGVGQEVEVSLLGTAIHMQAINVNSTLLLGRPMARPNRLRVRNPLANRYRCADDKWFILAELQTDRFWHNFCEVLGQESLEKDVRFTTAKERRTHFAELISILDKVFATKTRDEWVQEFNRKGCGIAFGPVYDLSETVSDRQTLDNDYVIESDHPVLGHIRQIGFPVWLSRTPLQIRAPAPELGQDTEQVLLEEAGYGWDEIAKLKEEDVI